MLASVGNHHGEAGAAQKAMASSCCPSNSLCSCSFSAVGTCSSCTSQMQCKHCLYGLHLCILTPSTHPNIHSTAITTTPLSSLPAMNRNIIFYLIYVAGYCSISSPLWSQGYCCKALLTCISLLTWRHPHMLPVQNVSPPTWKGCHTGFNGMKLLCPGDIYPWWGQSVIPKAQYHLLFTMEKTMREPPSLENPPSPMSAQTGFWGYLYKELAPGLNQYSSLTCMYST